MVNPIIVKNQARSTLRPPPCPYNVLFARGAPACANQIKHRRSASGFNDRCAAPAFQLHQRKPVAGCAGGSADSSAYSRRWRSGFPCSSPRHCRTAKNLIPIPSSLVCQVSTQLRASACQTGLGVRLAFDPLIGEEYAAPVPALPLPHLGGFSGSRRAVAARTCPRLAAGSHGDHRARSRASPWDRRTAAHCCQSRPPA